jgi:hypothetical protein
MMPVLSVIFYYLALRTIYRTARRLLPGFSDQRGESRDAQRLRTARSPRGRPGTSVPRIRRAS